MFNNKSQFTLFVILGFVILIIFSLFFFFLIGEVDDDVTLDDSDGLENVAFSIDTCLNNVFEEEVYNLLNHYFFTGPYNDDVPFLIRGDRVYLVDFDDLESVFKDSVLFGYRSNCLSLFELYEENNIIISYEEDLSIEVNSDFVSVDFGTFNIDYLDYSLSPSFDFVQYLDLERYYSFLFIYASLESENPGFFNIGGLLVSSFFYDLAYEIVDKEDKLVLIDLYDLEDNFILSFGVGYE